MSMNVSASAGEKLKYKMGGDQNQGWVVTYADFIKRHTNENDVIFIPPQTQSWQMEGNKDFFRWFLYPRLLEHSDMVEETPNVSVDAILIAYGAWPFSSTDFGWPKFSVSQKDIKEIWLIDRTTLEETKIVDTDYNFEPDKEIWGIILLKGNKQ